VTAKILVLEDDEDLREGLLECLEEQGYQALGASDAEEAVLLSGQHRFDLAISDIRLAGKLDGLAAMQIIKTKSPQLQVIVMTGYASDRSPTRAVELRARDYLHKPFGLTEFLRVVEHSLHWQQQESSFSNLVKGLMSPFKLVADKIEAQRKSEFFNQLSATRDLTLEAFYIKLRAKCKTLTAMNSFFFWQLIEPSEIQFHLVRHHVQDVSIEILEKVARAYEREYRWLSSRNDRPDYPISQPIEGLTMAVFSPFLERIQNGTVDLNMLKVAAPLRRLDPSKHTSDSRKLWELMWTPRRSCAK
jgi:DNA-binding response OmpR family regulator